MTVSRATTASRIATTARRSTSTNAQPAVVPLGFDLAARLAMIDQERLRRYRLERVRAELARRDDAAALLADPINIRYATGARNMAVWTLHAPGRYAFIATSGPVVL
ncbi:MAG: aminopeptidase P family N-terminal domain-containing protein, partial [Acetobacteraceae bacterium]